MAPQFEMCNGVLMRRVHLRARAGPANTMLVPLKFVETVIYYCHGDLMSAHLGKTKTLEKVRHHAFWPGGKKMSLSTQGAVISISVTVENDLDHGEPVECRGCQSRTYLDHFRWSLGNKYILVFVDCITRWAEAFVIQALYSISFINVMIDGVICRYGVLEQLFSDRGTNFTSETLCIKNVPPTAQGTVERFNDTLLSMLRLVVHETQTDWDVYLPRDLFVYRTSYHESLGDTPFISLYGRDPKLTLDFLF
ncbi:Gag-pol Polyprotein [Phytophthora megakarya]|uniref:Gag-pol Polyprotein n=1 Tax=Phytophthora megakarya TaxID=4795 RepID=A0A225VRI9_9STRA|nr:Gag-pol Polyprotein [Phytophthora megakarya]